MNDQVALRDEQVRLGLWAFLATVTMLFAAFASAYVVRRSGSDWRHVALPPILWLNTIVLAASSLALETANRGGVGGRWAIARLGCGVSLALGFGFLGGQMAAWRQLMAAGVYLPTSPHASFFYMITGAHAVHVVAALAVLTWASVFTWTGPRDRRRWAARFAIGRTFWHYLGGMWLFLLALVSV